jgi:phosphatidylethanolamine-binding protein (PEBP) family uncharacterized protein
VIVTASLMLSSCGGGSQSPGPAIVNSISLKSAAVAKGAIPSLYTCDGKDITPPLEWGAVPAGTDEIALLVIGASPERSTGKSRFSVEWAVAGLNPALHALRAGKLPRGAHVGQASDGKRRYSICPAKGQSERYEFAVVAVPPDAQVVSEFSGISLLRDLVQPRSPSAPTATGTFFASYKRR